jgi:hypothetical protein
MRTTRLIVAVSLVVLGLLVADSGVAYAQNNCTPISGAVYGALYRDAPGQPRYWHMNGSFTIGRELLKATISVESLSLINDGEIWQGTERWTFDFGEGNTIQLATDFVTEHMLNATKIYHIREVGTFVNGTGAFVNAYGNLTGEGPFGPGVMLHVDPWWPATVVPAVFWVAPTQGVICGLNRR